MVGIRSYKRNGIEVRQLNPRLPPRKEHSNNIKLSEYDLIELRGLLNLYIIENESGVPDYDRAKAKKIYNLLK